MSLSQTDIALRESLVFMEEKAGGRNAFIQALAGSKNPAAKTLLLALGKKENDNKSVFEVALSIKKDPIELQKAFSEGYSLQRAIESVNKLFENLPDVMEQGIEAAKIPTKEGTADRKMLYQMAGLFPKEGGLQISLNQNFQGIVQQGGVSPVTGTHDLLHENPYTDDKIIDVNTEDNNE